MSRRPTRRELRRYRSLYSSRSACVLAAPRTLALASMALVLAFSVTACGGASGDSESTTTSTTEERPYAKADWVKAADEICERTRAGEGSVRGRGLLTKGLALLEAEEDKLEALPIPPPEMTQVERLMRALGSVTGLMAAEAQQSGPPAAGESGEIELDRLLTALGTPITTMDLEFTAYGAKVCGEVSLGF